jgi:hypothetical protein
MAQALFPPLLHLTLFSSLWQAICQPTEVRGRQLGCALAFLFFFPSVNCDLYVMFHLHNLIVS